jgi:CheY-like chemotaxis protein
MSQSVPEIDNGLRYLAYHLAACEENYWVVCGRVCETMREAALAVFQCSYLFSETILMSTVLLVDDDVNLVEALTDLFELDGHMVLTAHNGREGLQRLQDGPQPGLILVDLMMPEMDGWEFLRQKNADPALAGIPTIAMSGTNTERPEGALDFFHKSSDIVRLRSRVNHWLNNAPA